MNWRTLFVPLLTLFLMGWAYHAYGWPGVVFVVSGGVLWVLLHFTRLVNILKRAANRPIGFVDSAVMLNAKLKPKVPLMHVIALTRSLGKLESEKDIDPEIYSWTDGTQSTVRCEFRGGRLVLWELTRLAQGDTTPQDAGLV
ncbi:MAG: glycerate kinase [Alphaproteobacteria bacterium]|nr:glycerate kinase [Alphaproteobacteria bacterium]